MNYKIKNKLRRPQIPSEALKILSMCRCFKEATELYHFMENPQVILTP